MDDIRFIFEERRTVQACAVLMGSSRRENYTKLLKLLYLADRASILETGSPITGSSFVSMKNGPVLSEVYECIKGDPVSSTWDRYMQRDGYNLSLREEPGDDELSDYDVALLGRLRDEHRSRGYSAMIDYVHALPEWKDPAPSKVAPLSVATVLSRGGCSADEILDVARTQAYMAGVDRLLAVR